MKKQKNDSSKSAERRLEVRELRKSDLDRGFIETLGNLSDVGGLSLREARSIFGALKLNPLYHVFVAVANDGQVVGATTLLVEQKFIHRGGLVGHIEDVVVSRGHESKGVGGSLVGAAVQKARDLGCYKCILDCADELVGFYELLGFRRHEVEMRIDLDSGQPRAP